MGIDIAQLSRWKNDEGWDEKIDKIHQRVGQRMGLHDLEDEQDLVVASKEEERHLTALRELAIGGLKAVQEGTVKFERMSEVQQALKNYMEFYRLIKGQPNERKQTTHTFELSGAKGDNEMVASLLRIAISAKENSDEEEPREIESESK